MEGVRLLSVIAQQAAAIASNEATDRADQQNVLIEQQKYFSGLQDSLEDFTSIPLERKTASSDIAFGLLAEPVLFEEPIAYLDQGLKSNAKISSLVTTEELQKALGDPNLDLAGGLTNMTRSISDSVNSLDELQINPGNDEDGYSTIAAEAKRTQMLEMLGQIIKMMSQAAKQKAQDLR